MSASAVTVSTTATLIVDPGDLATVGRDGTTYIHNIGTNDVFVGTDEDVTTSTGMPIAPGEKVGFRGRSGGSIYGIVAAATEPVRVFLL